MRNDKPFATASELADFGSYEPIPRLHEIEEPKPTSSSEWDHIQNLDDFFARIYRYYEEKGLYCIIASRILNISTLGFTIVFSGFLLLYVDWNAVVTGCPIEDECDIVNLAIYSDPLSERTGFKNALIIAYLCIFSLYWLWNVYYLLNEMRPLMKIHRFCCIKLGLSLRELQTMGWSELVNRIVCAQSTMRLCVVKELSALDIVSRVMRKENYFIAMLNKDILRLHVPGFRKYVMMTKTLEWNIYRCVLDSMFDENFRIKSTFTEDPAGLRKHMKFMAAANLAISPFMTVFLLVYFFLGNAEKIYHQPSSVGTRGWSALARWKLREFNELPHIVTHRLNSAYVHAIKYLEQFPSPIVSMFGKFVSFIVGAFAAALIGLALVDERLLEASLWGRKLVWYAAILGTVLAISRGMIVEENAAFNPQEVMEKVVKYTHYLPRHWRNRCHHQEVQKEFEGLLQYRFMMFVDEMLSIVVTPFILFWTLPQCAEDILEFVKEFTVTIDGVGDVCRLSVFDFENHGNVKYAAPVQASKKWRSNQGKMEKSFLSFCAVYPEWEPSESGQKMLHNISTQRAAVCDSITRSAILQHHATTQEMPLQGIYAMNERAMNESRLSRRSRQPLSYHSTLSDYNNPGPSQSQMFNTYFATDLEQQISHTALQEYYSEQDELRQSTASVAESSGGYEPPSLAESAPAPAEHSDPSISGGSYRQTYSVADVKGMRSGQSSSHTPPTEEHIHTPSTEQPDPSPPPPYTSSPPPFAQESEESSPPPYSSSPPFGVGLEESPPSPPPYSSSPPPFVTLPPSLPDTKP